MRMIHSEGSPGRSRAHYFLFVLVFLPLLIVGCSKVIIVKPVTGSTFASGEAIEFEGQVTRSFETGGADRSDELTWNSSIDGPLGAGRKVTANRLSVGAHGIKATWPGKNRSDSISIRIKP
jgi:hypothetical protein